MLWDQGGELLVDETEGGENQIVENPVNLENEFYHQAFRRNH